MYSGRAFAVLVTVFVAIGGVAVAPVAQEVNVSDQQARLSASFADRAIDRLSWRSDVDAPRFLAGDLGTVTSDRVPSFFEDHDGLFGDDRDLDVRVLRTDTDELGLTHVRVEQTVGGVPVWGAQSILHIRRDGQAYAWGGSVHPDASSVSVVPALDAVRAETLARRALGNVTLRASRRPTTTLVVLPDDGDYRLAFLVELFVESPELAWWTVFVDATTGDILRRFDALPTSGRHPAPPAMISRRPGAPGVTIGEGRGWYGDTLSFPTYHSRGVYYLRDTPPKTRRSILPFHVFARRSRGIRTTSAGGGSRVPGRDVVAADNRFTSTEQRSAVDVHYGVTTTYDYFRDVHGRIGYDGEGAPITSVADFSVGINNAFWDGEQLLFGNGDGVTYGPLVSLDVVAHEYTHAVTQTTAGLIYYGESGALNEAVSDIFAAMVDRDDFSFGELCYTPLVDGDAIRYLSEPSRGGQPDHYAHRYVGHLDNGGVHINSGIANKQAYLMVVGGAFRGETIVGVGREVTEQIWYRALTHYFTPSTDFAGARQGMLQAAVDVYGRESPAYAAVAAAWTAVGVGPGVEDGEGADEWEYLDILLQSEHDYPNDHDRTRTYTKPGAARVAVFFERIDVERGRDVVQVLDGGGWAVATYTGRHESFWEIVEDSTISVRLRTDATGVDYGYRVTRVAYVPAEPVAVPAPAEPVAALAADRPPTMRVGPNPTAGVAWVDVSALADEPVRITVVDVLGREVSTVHDGVLGTRGRLPIDLGGLPAGIYRVVLDTERQRVSSAITLVR